MLLALLILQTQTCLGFVCHYYKAVAEDPHCLDDGRHFDVSGFTAEEKS